MKNPLATTLAAAVAASLLAGCGPSQEPTGQTTQSVKCQGINECKGTSECASTDGNSCQGLNECKGTGWVTEESATSCTGKGGTVLS